MCFGGKGTSSPIILVPILTPYMSLIYYTRLVPKESKVANPLLLLTVLFSLPFPHVQTLFIV